MAKNSLSTATKTIIGGLAAMGGMFTSMSMGASTGTLESAWFLLGTFCALVFPIGIAGLVAEKYLNKETTTRHRAKDSQLHRIAGKYNDVTELLESNYNKKLCYLSVHDTIGREELREEYEKLYYENKSAFEKERTDYIESLKDDVPTKSSRFKSFWTIFVCFGLLAQVMACSYTAGVDIIAEEDAFVSSARQTYWNADNIPMPHLEDADRYVANPDHVVTDNTERLLNGWFKKLDDSLQIESVVILVNHVENDDPFRMAQDLGNNYGVGKNDRGLIVILAYEDHSIHISTGKSLEADLTDLECKRLQQTYLIPSMKAEQPDSGMLYLAEAIYNTLQRKELPIEPMLTPLSSDIGFNEADEQMCMLGLYMMLFCVWMGLIAYLRNRYVGTSGKSLLKGNPFFVAPVHTSSGSSDGGSSHGSSWHSSGGGFSGGGHHGGSFGGGSFGGGGATSRW